MASERTVLTGIVRKVVSECSPKEMDWYLKVMWREVFARLVRIKRKSWRRTVLVPAWCVTPETRE